MSFLHISTTYKKIKIQNIGKFIPSELKATYIDDHRRQML